MNQILIFSCAFAIAFTAIMLAVMAFMAKQAAKNSPPAISMIPAQSNLLHNVQEFMNAFNYRPIKELSDQNRQVYRKGRGLLTSLTDIIVTLQSDHSATVEVNEGVNFIVKKVYFPINSPSFLGLPVRQHKLKSINLLLQKLQAAPIEFAQSKKIKIKKR